MQCSSGKRYQTLIRQSISCIYFLSGGVISIIAKIANIPQAFNTKALLIYSRSSSTLFLNKRQGSG